MLNANIAWIVAAASVVSVATRVDAQTRAHADRPAAVLVISPPACSPARTRRAFAIVPCVRGCRTMARRAGNEGALFSAVSSARRLASRLPTRTLAITTRRALPFDSPAGELHALDRTFTLEVRLVPLYRAAALLVAMALFGETSDAQTEWHDCLPHRAGFVVVTAQFRRVGDGAGGISLCGVRHARVGQYRGAAAGAPTAAHQCSVAARCHAMARGRFLRHVDAGTRSRVPRATKDWPSSGNASSIATRRVYRETGVTAARYR